MKSEMRTMSADPGSGAGAGGIARPVYSDFQIRKLTQQQRDLDQPSIRLSQVSLALFSIHDVKIASIEFFGTFCLALVIACGGTQVNQDYGIGFALTGLVYFAGPISGGQFNPAVTYALWFRKRISWIEMCYNMFVQCMGVIVAAIVAFSIYSSDWGQIGSPTVLDTDRRSAAFVADMLQSFALITVYLNTTASNAQANNQYFGLAIGFSALGGALTQGNAENSVFNPAVALLTLLAGNPTDFWGFLFGPFVGATFAVLVFLLTSPHELEAQHDRVLHDLLGITSYAADNAVVQLTSLLTMEFIGTMILTYTYALRTVGGIFPVGVVYAAMMYAGGAVSGGHYNPAVTLAVYLRGITKHVEVLTLVEVCSYMGVQLLGAFVGGGIAGYIADGNNNIFSPMIDDARSQFSGFVVEFFFSLLLIMVVLSTAANHSVAGNSFFGIATGFTLIGAYNSIAGISGAVLNPAIGIALPAITDRNTGDIWAYVVGGMLAGILAPFLYMLWFPTDVSKRDVHGTMQEALHKESSSSSSSAAEAASRV